MIDTTQPAEPDHDAESEHDKAPTVSVRRDFADFYASEVKSVVGLAYVLSGSRAGAEDLAADAFLAAYRHWDRVRDYDDASAWVRRVAVNRAISTARRRSAEARAYLRQGSERAELPELSEPNEQLWASVRGLPRRQAQAIALHYLDGLSVHEIAHVLRLTDATVKTHLQRARQALATKHEG